MLVAVEVGCTCTNGTAQTSMTMNNLWKATWKSLDSICLVCSLWQFSLIHVLLFISTPPFKSQTFDVTEDAEDVEGWWNEKMYLWKCYLNASLPDPHQTSDLWKIIPPKNPWRKKLSQDYPATALKLPLRTILDPCWTLQPRVYLQRVTISPAYLS